MAGISSAVVAHYLEQLGWGYRIVDESTLVTGYRCVVRFYVYTVVIEIRSTEHWLYVRGLLQRDVAPAARDAMLRLLARWNERCHQVKFLLVEDCVLVQAEIPTIRCHSGSFLDGLFAVCRYSQQAGVEISVLATDPMTRDLVLTVEDAGYAERGSTGGTAVQHPDFEISINSLKT